MSLITEASFVDLYLGDNFSDVKGLDGATTRRVEAPAAWASEIAALRARCQAQMRDLADPEFALIEDGVVLRVTHIRDAYGGEVFILRKSNAQIRPFELLGFSEELHDALLDDATRGLVLFCGEMGTGKTSSAASLIAARLKACGGIALVIEDPMETNLNGQHGQGRCIQMQVSLRTGGYEEALLRAMRTGADMILIGEIRDQSTAVQAVRAAINGVFVVATLHAGSPIQAIERVASLASAQIGNAHEILSQGLVATIAQRIEGQGAGRTLKVSSLLLTGDDAPSIRHKIRSGSGHLEQLHQDIDNQSKRGMWG